MWFNIKTCKEKFGKYFSFVFSSKKVGNKNLGFIWKTLVGLWLAKLRGAKVDVFLMETSTELRQPKLASARDISLGETCEKH